MRSRSEAARPASSRSPAPISRHLPIKVIPYPYEPPRDDPELRAIIAEQYEAYVLDVDGYLNCLHGEIDRASREARAVIARWVCHFSDEAALRLPQKDDEDDD